MTRTWFSGGFAVAVCILAAAIFVSTPGRHGKLRAESSPAVPAAASAKQSAATTSSRSGFSPAAIQTARNLGKAYYEQGKYPEADQEFRNVIASGHALATDHFNLGLTLMQANKLDDALGELTTAKQMSPRLVAADYNLGILFKRELRYPDAEAALKRVVAADPNDPSGWFNLGAVYFTERKFAEALEAHKHVNRMGFGRGQNFYVASLFRTFTVLLRLGRQEEAQKILKIHSQFRDKVPSISLQNLALEGGKYGAILIPGVPPVTVGPAPQNVSFEDVTAKLGLSLEAAEVPTSPVAREIKSSDYSLQFALKNLVPLFGPSVALGDYDGDGHEDIYVVNPAAKNRLFHNNGDGTFTDVTEKAGVAGEGGDVAATFADYTNSGHPSLFVAGANGVTLYVNQGDGTFKNGTEKAGLHHTPGELDTCAVLFDADSDGYLDLVVTNYSDLNSPPRKNTFDFPYDFDGGHSHFYRNNADGTFTDITESAGLNSAEGRMRGAVFGDLAGNGYTDLVFFRDNAPPLLFINHGEDKFVNGSQEAGEAFNHATALSAQVADLNHDGRFDLVLWSPAGPQVLLNRGGARFDEAYGVPNLSSSSDLFSLRGIVADLDGDSFPDLLAVDSSDQWHFISNRAGKFKEEKFELPGGLANSPDLLSSAESGWLTAPGRLDLVVQSRTGKLAVYEKTGSPAHWVAIKLKGFKSNMNGVGTIVEYKAGNFYNKTQVTGNQVFAYTGNLAKLDVIRVTWPNLVIQNSINVATDTSVLVQESERLASSCPLLYVWDGEKYVFVTDVLGVGPLGELSPDGTRIRPNLREFVRLPDFVRPRDGAYTFQMTDELREVDYVDRVRLMAVDHPADEAIYANELYSSSKYDPELFAVRNEHPPVSAVDDRGTNVLDLVSKSDGRYPADFAKHRIPGMAAIHSLTLDLGDFPAAQHVALWLKGSVYWTDSNGSRAAMTSPNLSMFAPYVQVKNSAGDWVTVIPDMGLPSGTHRTMRVDLTGKFLTSDHHVRITTNLCIYWDRIFFTTDEHRVEPTSVAAPLSADLHYRGFSEPVSDPNHVRPDFYRYANLLKDAPWNPMTGNYTRYGDVGPLVTNADDHLVVMATGDEMTVKFNPDAFGPLKPGWKRDLFLDAAGYAKDGEPNTSYSKTVEPLPFRAMENYPPSASDSAPSSSDYERYLKEYQTRPGFKLITPLAPVLPTEGSRPR